MTSSPPDIVLLGAGAFAREVVWTVMRALPAATMAGILDDAANTQGSSVAGLSVLGGTEMLVEFQARPVAAVLAVGLPSVRRSLAKRAAAAGVELVTIIDPDALVHGSAELGPGCLVMAGSIVSTGARLGVGCLLNFGAMAGMLAGGITTVLLSTNTITLPEKLESLGLYAGLYGIVCSAILFVGVSLLFPDTVTDFEGFAVARSNAI